MRRRQFLTSACAWLLATQSVRAQERVWKIGVVHVGNDHVPPAYKSLREGMRALGYEEGRNVRYDFRNVADKTAAREAVRAFLNERIDLIVGFDNEACDAAHTETASVPVVMFNVGNPVAAGFAKTLANPGGNMTGFAGRLEVPAKELEILRDIAPRLTRVLVLFDPDERASLAWRADVQVAAKRYKFTLVEREAKDPDGIRQAFAALKPGTAEAMFFASPNLRHRSTELALGLAREHKLFFIANDPAAVERGALFAYIYDYAKVGRMTPGRYIDRILKGTKPQDLPIEEVTEYELTLNAGVLKRAGLTVPQSILGRVSKIIE